MGIFMIIFDLDGTLADYEHRRHFVQKHAHKDCTCEKGLNDPHCPRIYIDWEYDLKSFHEACHKDSLILPVWRTFISILDTHSNDSIQIWTERSESVREKTESWIMDNKSPLKGMKLNIVLKMRPIGDNTPHHELKEKWLDELIKNSIDKFMEKESENHLGVNDIEFVFDSDPKSIEMWKRRGIFVFDCNQCRKGF